MFNVIWYNASGNEGGSFGPFAKRSQAENCLSQLASRNEVKRAEIKEDSKSE